MRGRLLPILFTWLVSIPALSQGILVPEIINYPKKAYEAGNQSRAIGQDKRGLLYFANDDGLLVYDGTYWKTYTLPNGSIVRSLAVYDDRIYVGGQQEIGYFFFDPKGALTYRSLKPLIPPGETEFSDVWHVVPFEKDIFFRSNKRIFRFHDDKITAFKSINWGFLGTSRGWLIAQQYENGLMRFSNGHWLPLASSYDFSKDKMSVRSVTDWGRDQSLLATSKSGVYTIREGQLTKFETPSIAAIASEVIYSSCRLDTARTVIATKLGGYYVVNTRGEILQHLTKQEGLQSNTVNSVFIDQEKNFWLALNNGIDLVIYDNPVNHVNPSQENKSPGYSAALYDHRLYIGTGFGLYSMPIGTDNDLGGMKGSFSLVKNSNGLVWRLSVVNDQLLVGRNDGAYLVSKDQCIPLDTSTGFWSFLPLAGAQPGGRVIAGTYNGMNAYDFREGRFINPKIHTFFESAKNIVVLGDELWVAHAYQGLYKIWFRSPDSLVNTPYKDVQGILSSGHNHLFKIHDKMVLTTRKGVYEYDKAKGDFSESAFFRKLFGPVFISYLREDAQGNIWFIEDKKPGVIDLSSPDKPAIIHFSELNNSVLGNDEEFIYPINKNNVLIAGETGFYHVDYEKYKETDRSLRVLLRTVTAFHKKDSTLFGGYLPSGGDGQQSDVCNFQQKIRYKWNSIHFEFSSPYFGETVEYACRLTGYEKDWSPWSRKTERSYTNLPAGSYVFEVMARNSIGRQSPVSRFIFTISPPWYNTFIAYLLYLALFIAIVYFFYKRQQKKYILRHRRLQDLHQLEIEKNEKEIIRLKNIRLEAEVQHNNAELALNTMSLLQKRELLNKIKDEILNIQDEPESDNKRKNIRRIIKVIHEQLAISDDWERFSLYFDKVNNDFFKILKEKHPSLTATDLKLCAYLRINLSTKAIADLLNLSIRGVESSRYRLRKKLDLSNDITLFDFLASVGSTHQNTSNGL